MEKQTIFFNYFSGLAAILITFLFSASYVWAEDNYLRSPRGLWEFTIELPADELSKVLSRNGKKVRSFEMSSDRTFIIGHHGPDSPDWNRDWGTYSVNINSNNRNNAGFNDCLAKAEYAQQFPNYIVSVFANNLRKHIIFESNHKIFRQQRADQEAELGRSLTRSERKDLRSSIRETEVLRKSVKLNARRHNIECVVFYFSADGVVYIEDEEIYQ